MRNRPRGFFRSCVRFFRFPLSFCRSVRSVAEGRSGKKKGLAHVSGPLCGEILPSLRKEFRVCAHKRPRQCAKNAATHRKAGHDRAQSHRFRANRILPPGRKRTAKCQGKARPTNARHPACRTTKADDRQKASKNAGRTYRLTRPKRAKGIGAFRAFISQA